MKDLSQALNHPYAVPIIGSGSVSITLANLNTIVGTIVGVLTIVYISLKLYKELKGTNEKDV